MTIKEILEKYGRTHKDNVVYLGYENGWGEKTYDLLKELEAFEVKGIPVIVDRLDSTGRL